MKEDNDDDEEFYFGDFIESLKMKLQDEETIKTIVEYKNKIENKLGCPILISIPMLPDEEHEEILNLLNNYGIDNKTNTLKVSKVIDLLKNEDNEDLNVFIDPIHLNEGLNPLVDLLVLGMDDHIILIPKNKV